MENNGIIFHWKVQVSRCDPMTSGGVRLTLQPGETLDVDAVLVAAGRKSNVASLNLGAAGGTGDRGLIPVDEFYRTSVSHICAAGDVIGFPALASTSMEQARRAVRQALGVDLTAASGLLPTGVYTIPEVSMVGETEESLTRAGIDYTVGRAPYFSSGRGRIIGDSDGFLKLLFQRSNLKLLGVHVIGEQATELVHVGLIALLTVRTLTFLTERASTSQRLEHYTKSQLSTHCPQLYLVRQTESATIHIVSFHERAEIRERRACFRADIGACRRHSVPFGSQRVECLGLAQRRRRQIWFENWSHDAQARSRTRAEWHNIAGHLR